MHSIPIVIDVEASGFGKGSYPIEVGFSRAQGHAWCSLIRPEQEWVHWDATAAQVHCIERGMLFKSGKNVHSVAEHLNLALAGQTIYTDGWAHDYIWLARLFDAAERVPSFHLADFREIITPAQEALWHATKDQLIKELQLTRHRASNDARILQLTWLRTHDASRSEH